MPLIRPFLLALAALTATSSVSANIYPFDTARTEDQYGRSQFQVYKKQYMQLCGSYKTLDHSDIFGDERVFDVKYPRVGEMHAEIDQVSDIGGSTRRSIDDVFKDIKYKLDVGHFIRRVNENQVADSTSANMTSDTYIEQISERAEDGVVGIDKGNKLNEQDAISRVTSSLKSDVRNQGSGIYSRETAFDRWQQCQSFWKFSKKGY